MKHNIVGKSGLRVSELTLGSWRTFGRKVDIDIAQAMVDRCIELGIYSFDCANVYELGEAEKMLGKVLKKYPRNQVVVSTKVFFPMESHPNCGGLSRKHIMESIDASLKRLNMDYVDILYCHRFDETVPLLETLQALNDVVNQNKAFYIGVSMWSVEQLKEANAIIETYQMKHIIVNQPPMSIINQNIVKDLVSMADLGVGQMVFSPLAQGILTGKYNHGIPADSRRATMDMMADERFDKELEIAKALEPIATANNVSLTTLAISWILRHEQVASCIIGATTIAQLEENVAAINYQMSDDVYQQIQTIYHHFN